MKYNEEECREFYKIAKSRMQKGYSEEAIFAGKPEGFSQWLKDTWPDRKIKKNNILKNKPKYQCWHCNKEYNGNKCPFCGAFKPQK